MVLKRIELERTLLINLGKEFQLNIVCETNLKIVKVLDVTLDLTTGKYNPYNKPGNIPLYINVKSNQPPNILRTYQITFHVVSINHHPMNLYLKILKIFTIVHFLTVVLKIKSNSTQIIKGISVRITTGKKNYMVQSSI